MGETTEWHRIGEYRVSFDRRTKASRFIVVRSVGHDTQLIAQGLIESALIRTRCLCDSDYELPDGIEGEIVERWEAMRDELLRTGERPWGEGT